MVSKTSFILALLLAGCNLKQPQQAEQLPAPKNFKITLLKNQSFKLVADGFNQHPYRCRYKANVMVRNLTDRTVDYYYLKINYRSYNAAGESYLLFNAAYDMFSFGETDIWYPDSEKTFTVEEYIGHDHIIYPTNRIEVIFSIYATDPFDTRFNEEIASYDVTSEWLKFQSNYFKKTHIKK